MNNTVLNFNTVKSILKDTLELLMRNDLFSPFRLVGGTNLSLRFGHRMSDDIDLFTDEPYDSLDFNAFENWLKSNFIYYDCTDTSSIVGFGRSYYIGDNPTECVKLDLMYAPEKFLDNFEVINGIRMATIRDMIAMKMHAIYLGGRKKDFWDINLLMQYVGLDKMIEIHKSYFEWEEDRNVIIDQLCNFKEADEDFEPICLLDKNWIDIKLEILDKVSSLT